MPVIATAFGNVEPLILLGVPIILLAIAALLVAARQSQSGSRSSGDHNG